MKTSRNTRTKSPSLLALVAVILLASLLAPAALAGQLTVFAAASLTDALAEVGQTWEQKTGNTVHFSFASSSTLARQIAAGAPADVFVSADIKWMDYLQKHKAIKAGSRRQLLANKLALIAPADSAIDHVDIGTGFNIAQLLGGGRLAMGNPAHVPAGIYGKQALQSLGVWSSISDQVARSADVRAALALVALGEAPLGIVYRTDAFASDKVKIVGIFPGDSHKPVIYPAALTANNTDAAAKTVRRFYQFLASGTAAMIFKSYGFKVLPAR